MSSQIGLEATVYGDGTSTKVRVFSARKFAGWWWSREAVTRDSAAMFGAWRGLVDLERREIKEERR